MSLLRSLVLCTTTLVCLVVVCHAQLQNGDPVCTEGFIMDNFCLMRGRMLDNGLDPLRFPEEHTVHCLVDVDICRSSGFVVLIDPAPDEEEEEVYTVGYALDGDGTNILTRLAREVGASCSTCLGTGSLVKGMRAGIMGTVLDAAMVPPLIKVDFAEYVSPDMAFCEAQIAVTEPPMAATTLAPTLVPTVSPTLVPSREPTLTITARPTHNMTPTNTNASTQATNRPTLVPTGAESAPEMLNGTEFSDAPSALPTNTAVSDTPSAGPTTDDALQQGDEVCHVGYVMDNFCLSLGFLLDDNDVVTLEQPFLHSIQCLVDVPMCVESNYTILAEPAPGESLYSVAYQFDAVGTMHLAEMARRVGERGYCTTCTGGDGGWMYGFRVGVKGIVLNATNMTPPLIEIVDATYSSDGSFDYCAPDYAPPPDDELSPTIEPTLSIPEPSTAAPSPASVPDDGTNREMPKITAESPTMDTTTTPSTSAAEMATPNLLRIATMLMALGLPFAALF